MNKIKIGIDLGGTISDIARAGYVPHYVQIPYIEGAVSAVAFLNHTCEIHIISHVWPAQRQPTWEWLGHNKFFELTGLRQERVRLVSPRTSKAAICQQLGIDVFIDNHPKVLDGMIGIVRHLLLFCPSERVIERGDPKLIWDMTAVNSWLDAIECLCLMRVL